MRNTATALMAWLENLTRCTLHVSGDTAVFAPTDTEVSILVLDLAEGLIDTLVLPPF